MRMNMKKLNNLALLILLGLIAAISFNKIPYTNFNDALAQEEEEEEGEEEITLVQMSEDERRKNGVMLSIVEEQGLNETKKAHEEVR